MTEPQITDEVRRAVYAADCTYWGHQYDFRSAVGGTDRPNPNDERGMPMPVLRAPAAGQIPHLRCGRCGAVWLVVDEPGRDYDDAVTNLAARVAKVTATRTDALAPRPIDGVGDRPIPLAPGVVWDDLPAEHPAVQFSHTLEQEHEHAEQGREFVTTPDVVATQDAPEESP